MEAIFFGLAAVAGAALRYGLTSLSPVGSEAYPLQLGLVNVLGSAAFGAFLFLFTSGRLDAQFKSIILVGFLGSLTTFASFSAVAMEFLQKQQWGGFIVHVGLTNIFSILGCWMGFEGLRRLVG